jgi:hypothetical protein
VGRVVSKVPASAEGHLWRIDTMSRRSLTLRPGRHFVVLIVVVVGMFRCSAPRSRAGRRFSSMSSLCRWVFEWLPSGRRRSLSVRSKAGAMVAVLGTDWEHNKVKWLRTSGTWRNGLDC